ncbi:MAG: SusC/RagA family TonB-linked outer membrane protein [Candidatus Pseudobacter hemicellulosilyticus]|uniref:SusC/RagA family TonB-linked outer membrane protein n=1 Tax=Candidatus Pseudobacter hemicellulosilyticus TaxID=3121375 RepID=A0AAJ5WPW4_9BACT|nr:MAG: SusC/RagA family TonB-linked outer membrane protein [Pseudobacter sp.]
MKLLSFFLFVAMLSAHAEGVGQTVTISGKDLTLKQVFAAIEKQTGYVVLSKKALFSETATVAINATNMPLQALLDAVLKDMALQYIIRGKTIFLDRKAPVLAPPATAPVFLTLDPPVAPPVTVRITDEQGQLLSGASVLNRKTKRSGITNAQGICTIEAGTGDVLEVSYVGYERQLVTVRDAALSVVLKLSETEMEEVFINKGYYSQSRITNVGGVSTLTAKDIEKQPVSNILDVMVGRLNGLEVFPSSGVAGTAPAMMVRGRSGFGTIASGNSANPPLVIVDGVPMPPNMLVSNGSAWKGSASNLNNLLGLSPADVESISVLKDGDATAIYGSRGSNGVILITTKRGKGNGVRTNLTASTGFQKMPHFLDMLNNDQYRSMREEALANSNTTPTATNAPDLLVWDKTKTHDWQRELLGGTARMNDVSLSVSGGSGNTRFYVSGSYHDQGSVMPGDSKMMRGAFNASLNYLSNNKKLSLDVQTSYSLSDLNLLSNDLSTAAFYAPNYPVYTATGELDWTGNSTNPYATTRQQYELPTKNYSGTIQVGYELLKGLKLKTRAGFNAVNTRMAWEQPLNSLNPNLSTSTATLILQNSDNGNWIVEPFAEYNRAFGAHHLSVVSGFTFNRQYQKGLSLRGTGFPNDRMVSDIAAATTIDKPTSTDIKYAYAAFYTRVGYDFAQKYLVNLTFRRDGSTRFGPGNKFGNFGAIGLGWVFTGEQWAADALPFLSYGKLRASYGTSGNDNIPDFYYIPYYTTRTAYNGTALLPANLDNPDLKWEMARKFEGGLELGFLNNRISLSAAWFRNRIEDGLLYYLIAPLVPFNYFISNYPSVIQNSGVEIELSSHNLKGAFTWDTRLNLSKTAGKMVEFPNIERSSYSNTYVVGESMTLFKVNHSTGLNEKGEPLIPSTLPADRVVAGNKDPFFGSMVNDFSYKNFSFSFLLQFNRQRGTPTYIPTASPGSLNQNMTTYVLDRWQKAGDEQHTNIPRFGANLTNYNNYISSDLNTVTEYIFRLGNASFAYSLPEKFTRQLRIEKLNVFCNAQNLYVFDKYRKWRFDPATGNSGLPPLRTIVFGINVTL